MTGASAQLSLACARPDDAKSDTAATLHVARASVRKEERFLTEHLPRDTAVFQIGAAPSRIEGTDQCSWPNWPRHRRTPQAHDTVTVKIHHLFGSGKAVSLIRSFPTENRPQFLGYLPPWHQSPTKSLPRVPSLAQPPALPRAARTQQPERSKRPDSPTERGVAHRDFCLTASQHQAFASVPAVDRDAALHDSGTPLRHPQDWQHTFFVSTTYNRRQIDADATWLPHLNVSPASYIDISHKYRRIARLGLTHRILMVHSLTRSASHGATSPRVALALRELESSSQFLEPVALPEVGPVCGGFHCAQAF